MDLVCWIAAAILYTKQTVIINKNILCADGMKLIIILSIFFSTVEDRYFLQKFYVVH